MDVKVQRSNLKSNEQLADDANFEVLIDSRRESDYLEMLGSLKYQLADKSSECEMLKIELAQSRKDIRDLNRDLNECKLTMFQNNEDALKSIEESKRSKKLEEDYVKLMEAYLESVEQCNNYRQNIHDKFIAKSNLINSYECLMSSEKLHCELEDCRSKLNEKSAEIILTTAKLRNMEEENNIKDKSISELKKSLDDAKVAHKHEIKVLEEYIGCLKNTIISYEKTLTDYMDEQTMKSGDEGLEAQRPSENG